jgi:hypothetical protein
MMHISTCAMYVDGLLFSGCEIMPRNAPRSTARNAMMWLRSQCARQFCQKVISAPKDRCNGHSNRNRCSRIRSNA